MGALISVIMPVCNVEKYVSAAIDSILSQTYENFEFIIIDDASTDHTFDIINQFHDQRIIILQNKTNLGVANTLNRGIAFAHGEFIARMDGDDISKPERFEKQTVFMETNPHLLISGTHMDLINNDGKFIKVHNKRVGNEAIRIGLFFGHTSLAHPSIMIRRQLLDLYHLRYDSAFWYAEDYDLYCRATQYALMDNIPESLIQYRLHDESVSQKFHMCQILDAKASLYLHLKRLKVPLTLEQFEIHASIAHESSTCTISKSALMSWFDNLKMWNKNNQYFNTELFEKECYIHQNNLLQRMNT